MKKIIYLISILAMLVFLTACTSESADLIYDTETIKKAVTPTDISQMPLAIQKMIERTLSPSRARSGVSLRNSGRGNGSNEAVYSFATEEVVGHSSVARTKKGAHISYQVKGLIPGDAVTLWIIVAGLDENCNPFFVDLISGGGKVVTRGGVFKLNTFLANGDNSNSVFPEFGDPLGPGMDNSFETVLHFIYRTHGEYIGDPDQLSTLDVFCEVCEDLGESIHYVVCPE